jgi:hypothetical protein
LILVFIWIPFWPAGFIPGSQEYIFTRYFSTRKSAIPHRSKGGRPPNASFGLLQNSKLALRQSAAGGGKAKGSHFLSVANEEEFGNEDRVVPRFAFESGHLGELGEP